MFKNIFKRPLPKPIFDPALRDPLGQKILAEAKAGQAQLLQEKIVTMREGQWDRRMFYVDLAGEFMASRDKVEALPDTAVGNLIRGTHAIHWAWEARGSGQAESVQSDQWPVFFQRLELGVNNLLRAAEQDPSDPSPFAILLTAGMGLQVERHVTDEWFMEAIRRDPLHQQAHYRMLFLLCEKWGGSHSEMYDFAKQTVRKSPRGSTLASVLYLAFQEHYLYLVAFERDKEAAQALLADKKVQQKSLDIYQKSLALHQQIDNPANYWPHNVAAWWFLTLNNLTIAKQEIAKIGLSFTRFPWGLFDWDPADGYHRALNA